MDTKGRKKGWNELGGWDRYMCVCVCVCVCRYTQVCVCMYTDTNMHVSVLRTFVYIFI